ncbi:YopX family protein [Streptococcus suis]
MEDLLRFRVWDTFDEDMVNDIFFSWQDCGYESLNECLSDERWKFMQSTGLFDKNGKEIFEGDIVVNQNGNVGYVAYLQQEAGFVVALKKSDYRLGHRNTGESYDVTTNHEIIGNIHQNPELLEVE